jgi:hypothetical protein
MKWWDWLMCSSKDLKIRGLDPADRIHHTGHKRALSARWARSIGMWSRLEPADIMAKVFDPRSDDDKRKARMCFDLFLNRHNLMSRDTWMAKFLNGKDVKGFMRAGRVQIATYAHARIHLHRIKDPGLSVGAAAAIGVLRDYKSTEIDRLGILPVEAMLYYYAIEHILEQTGIGYDDWVSGHSGQSWLAKASYWDEHDCVEFLALPEEALEKYAES